MNQQTGIVWLDTDEECLITNLYDAFGEETDDFDEAVSALAPLADGRWLVIDLTQYDSMVN